MSRRDALNDSAGLFHAFTAEGDPLGYAPDEQPEGPLWRTLCGAVVGENWTSARRAIIELSSHLTQRANCNNTSWDDRYPREASLAHYPKASQLWNHYRSAVGSANWVQAEQILEALGKWATPP